MGFFITLVKLLGGKRATAFAAVALVALAFAGLQTYRVHSYQEKEQAAEVAVQAARADAEAKARVTEGFIAMDHYLIQSKAYEAQKDAEKTRDDVLAGIRSGKYVLRSRFTCPVPTSSVAGAASGTTAGEGAGLLREDEEFLVRIASEADQVVIERNEAVELYQSAKKRLEEHDGK